MKNLFNRLSKLGTNKADTLGRTSLYKAAKHGNLKEVKRLLKSGADPNIPNHRGLTPLHQAAYWGELQVMKELIKAGADPKADNGHGWTPLHSAALAAGLEKRREVIELLLKLGADPKKKDMYGWAPADYAALWEDESNPKLSRILAHMSKRQFADEAQQPNMEELGLKKDPPTGNADNDNSEDKAPSHRSNFLDWFRNRSNFPKH